MESKHNSKEIYQTTQGESKKTRRQHKITAKQPEKIINVMTVSRYLSKMFYINGNEKKA